MLRRRRGRGGLTFVQTHEPGPVGGELTERTGNARPILRSVRLTAGTCTTPDAYFAEPCTAGGGVDRTVGVEARVDFGTGTTDPRRNGHS